MKYLQSIKFLMFVILLSGFSGIKAQVTVGMGEKPADGAILQLKETDETGVNSARGLLMPRVKLLAETGTDMSETMANASATWDKKVHTGLWVYNTNTVASTNICPGLYHWNGEKWVRMHEKCPVSICVELSSVTIKGPVHEFIFYTFEVDEILPDDATEPLTYQWYLGDTKLNDGGGISGSTTPTLQMPAPAVGTVYTEPIWLKVSNACSYKDSNKIDPQL